MPLTVSLAAYFVAAAVIAIGAGRLRRASVSIAVLPFIGQLGLVAVLAASSSAATSESIDWIPALGVTIGDGAIIFVIANIIFFSRAPLFIMLPHFTRALHCSSTKINSKVGSPIDRDSFTISINIDSCRRIIVY